MIDHATGFIHTVAGDGETGDDGAGRRRRTGDERAPRSCRATSRSRRTATSTSPTCTTTASGGSTPRRDIITTVAGNGAFGATPATAARRRRRAWPARRASRSSTTRCGRVTIFIADYYNGRVRAVGPDGIIRNVSDEGRVRSARRRASRSRPATRLALRGRLEQRPGRRAEHPDGVAPRPRRAPPARRRSARRRPTEAAE